MSSLQIRVKQKKSFESFVKKISDFLNIEIDKNNFCYIGDEDCPSYVIRYGEKNLEFHLQIKGVPDNLDQLIENHSEYFSEKDRAFSVLIETGQSLSYIYENGYMCPYHTWEDMKNKLIKKILEAGYELSEINPFNLLMSQQTVNLPISLSIYIDIKNTYSIQETAKKIGGLLNFPFEKYFVSENNNDYPDDFYYIDFECSETGAKINISLNGLIKDYDNLVNSVEDFKEMYGDPLYTFSIFSRNCYLPIKTKEGFSLPFNTQNDILSFLKEKFNELNFELIE